MIKEVQFGRRWVWVVVVFASFHGIPFPPFPPFLHHCPEEPALNLSGCHCGCHCGYRVEEKQEVFA